MKSEIETLIVALDAGTSTMRAVLFDLRGGILRKVSRHAPEGSRACDPDAIAALAVSLIAELNAPPKRVVAVGVTAALGLTLLDRRGQALIPILSWSDRRAAGEAEAIARTVGAERLYAITGRHCDAELIAPKLLLTRSTHPQALAAAETACSLKDWLIFRLTGARVTDPASASYSLLYDVRRGEWHQGLLDQLGFGAGFLPDVRDATSLAGGLSEEAAHRTGLLAGTPVVVGGPDGTMGCIGGGLVKQGVAVDVVGTTDVVFCHTDSLQAVTRIVAPLSAGGPPPGSLVVNRFPAGNAWLVGGPMFATGGAAAWFAELLGGDMAELTAAAGEINPGSDGLLVSPVLAGSRAPRWNSLERAVISGLGLNHSRGHIFRAVLEGCASDVAELFDALEASGLPINEVRAVGGGTRNALWLRIRASMLGRPLLVPETTESSALGAAMAAATGAGVFVDLAEACDRMIRMDRCIEPDPEWAGVYRDLRQRLGNLQLDTLAASSGAARS